MAPKKKNEEQTEESVVHSSKKIKEINEQSTVNKTEAVRKTRAKKVVVSEPTGSVLESESTEIAAPVPEHEMRVSVDTVRSNRGSLLLGAGLLIMGFLLLISRFLSISFGDYLWPFIFIIPGLLLLVSSVASESRSGEGLSILGAILASLGMVFLFQSVSGLWASWAYIWALIAPASVGAAQIIYGTRHNRDTIVQSGKKLVNIGLIIFVIGFIFFELILGINGFGIANLGLPVFPVILVFMGIIILVRALLDKK